MIRPYAASYECGRALVAAGCPIDYLGNLPRNPASHRSRLYVRQLNGYEDSRIYELSPCDAAFVIVLSIGTEVPSGIIISDWSFVLPWDQHLNWDYDPRDVVPNRDHGVYERLFDSPLSAVLNERRILARGRPVEGLLCGRGFEPIPESIARGETVRAKLSVTDDRGYTATSRIVLTVDRTFAARPSRNRKRLPPIFECPDPPQKYPNALLARPCPVGPLPPELSSEELASNILVLEADVQDRRRRLKNAPSREVDQPVTVGCDAA